jgi:hypothetical protein
MLNNQAMTTMKTNAANTRKRNILLTIASLILALAFGSCSQKANFLVSSVVPAAKGKVTVSKTKNENYDINIQLTDLADPSRLQPAKALYVVWMETGGNPTQNIGQIKTSSGFLSSNMKSSFQTTSSSRPSKIFITAEDDPTVRYPDGVVVLTTAGF